MRGSSPRSKPHGRLHLLLAFFFLSLFTSSASAQQSWEYTPYDIRVWIARSYDPQTNDRVGDEMAHVITSRAASLAGAVWSVSVTPPPDALRTALVDDFAAVAVDDINKHGREALLLDKLFLVSLDFDAQGYRLQVRELDCRTRRLGEIFAHRIPQREVLGPTAYSSITAAFSPLARLEDLTDEDRERGVVRMRLRAGGLIYGENSPAEVAPGGVLLPIVRYNDRLGEPKVNGIQEVPWTLLQVEQRDHDILLCNVHSGMRSPFTPRAGRRTERVALAVKPRRESTRLRLALRTDASQPLAGYEVFAKPPQKGDVDGAATAQLIGQTDWRGIVDIPRGEHPLVIAYVKSGGQLLARLPIAPGSSQEAEAFLSDDTPRLRAEGFVVGLQSNVMDLVARREVLAMRIRKFIAEKNYDEAEKLINEFRALDTRDDLINRLDARSGLTSPDRRVQARIDKLFSETRKVLASYLDPKEADLLLTELTTAKAAASGGGSE